MLENGLDGILDELGPSVAQSPLKQAWSKLGEWMYWHLRTPRYAMVYREDNDTQSAWYGSNAEATANI